MLAVPRVERLEISKRDNVPRRVVSRNSRHRAVMHLRKQMYHGSDTAPVRPHAVPVDIGCAEGDVPVINTSTPPGHATPFTVTAAATIDCLLGERRGGMEWRRSLSDISAAAVRPPVVTPRE